MKAHLDNANSISGSGIDASRLTCSGVSEASPAAQDEDHFAAAAPRQTLPGLGLAIAGDLETATRALEAPVKLQQVPAYHPLRTAALLPRRLRRRHGRHGCFVEAGDLLPGKLLSGPGPSQQRVSVGHVLPLSPFPRFGSRKVPCSALFPILNLPTSVPYIVEDGGWLCPATTII